ncbi:hypothetical protein PHMEG_00014499 [Phytophthora megakarya]|uniref:Uncharacterized protein n=1 Tax=Phytophthora megakarya TaxID=4795 RepID=A0A225W5Q7_9STRA|nr:hypothetical protein PHMEG_00014499 [Phytophthora megakarya]
MLKLPEDQWRNVRQGKRVAYPETGSAAATEPKRPLTREQKKALKAEFSISSSDDDDMSSDDGALQEDSGTSDQHTPHLIIRLNPKARKVGAPKKAKIKTIASEKSDRKWFETAEQGRKAAGEVTLNGLLEARDRAKTGLAETQRKLAGVLVKYTDANLTKPKFKRMKNPVLILDRFYLLPTKLLDACIAAFPYSNTVETAIAVDCSQPEDIGKVTGPPGAVEVVQIKDVENLKKCVQLGVDMHKRLTEQGIPSLPAGYHDCGQKVASESWTSYPHKRIDGLLDMADFDYSMLYRATGSPMPPSGHYSAATSMKRTRATDDTVMEKSTRDRVLCQVEEPVVDTIILPLNFNNAH